MTRSAGGVLDFVYLGIGVIFASYVASVSWIITGVRITRRIRGYKYFILITLSCSKYLQSVLRQNIAFFDRIGAGEIANRLSHDADLIRDGISEYVSRSSQKPLII
jgi:ATP-binding cassette subfamily B (MDR/TAP) protein 1